MDVSIFILIKWYLEILGFLFFILDFVFLFLVLGFFGCSFFDEVDIVWLICLLFFFNLDLGDFFFGWENWFFLNFCLWGLEEFCGIFILENLMKV